MTAPVSRRIERFRISNEKRHFESRRSTTSTETALIGVHQDFRNFPFPSVGIPASTLIQRFFHLFPSHSRARRYGNWRSQTTSNRPAPSDASHPPAGIPHVEAPGPPINTLPGIRPPSTALSRLDERFLPPVHVFFMLNRPRFYLLSHPSSMASAYQSLLLVLCFEEICTFGTEEESRSGRAPSQSDRRARSSRPESLGEETTAPQYVYNGHPERAGLPQIALWDRPGGKQNHRKIRRDQWARIRKTALRASNVLRHVPSWEGATA